jgi:hypothetical protein
MFAFMRKRPILRYMGLWYFKALMESDLKAHLILIPKSFERVLMCRVAIRGRDVYGWASNRSMQRRLSHGP